MNDMSSVIVPKSDQINADDLIGRDMTITINDVQIRGGQEQPVSIFFNGSDKAFRPCKSMSRVLVYCWGADAKQYVGRSLTLYRDPNVKWGGMAVGGIRISHASHIDGAKTMVLAESKASRKPYTVKPLQMAAGDGSITLEDALADMEASGSLDDLSTVWRRRIMAPHREALQSDLDRLKARFAEAASDVSDRGESHTTTAADLIALIDKKVRAQDVIELVASWGDQIDAMSDDDRAAVATAQAERITTIKAGGQ